jgi:hypothetical protein
MTTTDVVVKIGIYVLLSAGSAALLGRATRGVKFPIALRAAVASLLLSWTPSPIPLIRIAHFIKPSASIFAGYFIQDTFIAEDHYFAFAAMLTLSLSFLAYWHFALPKVTTGGETP